MIAISTMFTIVRIIIVRSKIKIIVVIIRIVDY